MESGWRSVRLDEIDPIRIVGGTLLWRPVRLTLDIGAFGINAYTAPNAGDDVVEQHTEKLYRHEEVYVVLSGRATFTLGDDTLDAPAGTVVFIHDPTVRRDARAAEANTSVLAVGGPRDAAYEPSGWEEHVFIADKHRAVGDYEAAAAEISRGLDRHPDDPGLLYDLGRVEALAGRPEDALEHVRRALELKPEFGEHAQKDPDLVSLRALPGWPL